MEILDREEERSNDEGEPNLDGDEDLEVGGEALLEERFVIDMTCADTLELDILPRETSSAIEGRISVVCRLPCTPPW